jgi:hypothetical protein
LFDAALRLFEVARVSAIDSNGRTIWIADANGDEKRFPSKEIPARWLARLHGRIFTAVTATVRGSRRDACASPSQQQCNPIESTFYGM